MNYNKDGLNVFVSTTGHNDIDYSVFCLFEKRLGMNVFRAVGDQWKEMNINVHCESQAERMNGESEFVNEILFFPLKMEEDGGYYNQKYITFEKFLKMDIDIMVSISNSEEEAFLDLMRKYKKGAKLINMIGNILEMPMFSKNVLLGMKTPMPSDINYMTYHLEHYEGYYYTSPITHDTINCFVMLVPYPRELILWRGLKNHLSDFTFNMFGQYGEDGAVKHWLMPKAMKDSAFIWNVKPHGGGGFVSRQALACGRPNIIRKKYCSMYHSDLFDLYKDGVNCIDLDARSLEESAELIRKWSDPSEHVMRCKLIADMFKEDVNFSEEAKRIEKWISEIEENEVSSLVVTKDQNEEKIVRFFNEELKRFPRPHELKIYTDSLLCGEKEEIIRKGICGRDNGRICHE